MDGILNIFQGIANSEGESLNIYLKALNEHQSFRLKNSTSSDPVVQHITSVLSKPATRYEGLILLNNYLEQCSVEVLEQKGVLWMTLTLKACNAKEAENVGSFVYVVLKTLAIKSVEIPDVSKAFVSNFLNKIYDSLSTVNPCAYHTALECIETCLRLYPGPSGPSRGSIEKFLLKFTDVPDDSIIQWSGKCFHLLQQVRGGGVQGISHKAAWTSYQLKLLGSLHNLLDSAFSNCTELYDDAIEKEQLNIAPLQLSDEPIQKAMQIYIRFKTLIKYLIAALRQPFPVAKAIAPKKILNLITRGLSVTCPMLQKNQIFDNVAIGALLPEMQVLLFELLQAAILTLKSHLAMYHTTILGAIHDTLKWTSSKKSTGHQKPFSSLRCAAYETLSLWCKTMKHGSRCEIIADGIIEEILFDVTPFENAFTLKVLSGAKKHMSKKARRQLHKAQNEQSNLAQAHSNPNDNQAKKQLLSDKGNQTICLAALECLSSIFLSAGFFLKPTVVKSTHIKIVTICLSLPEIAHKGDHLYSNYACRVAIYNVLSSFINAPHHLCPPPTQMAVSLLQIAQIRDLNATVRETCSVLLTYLEKIIHPQKESLVFPPDVREIRNAFYKVGKEKLLVGDLNEENNQDDDSSESEDENNLSVHETEMVVLESQEKEDPSPSENLIDATDSVDLTLDDVNVRDPIHLDSSNDSVEFISEKQIDNKNEHEQVEIEGIFEIPKSPEMTLRVEEEEDEEESKKDEKNTEKPNDDKDKQDTNKPPSPKKPRLEENDAPVTNNEEINETSEDKKTKGDDNEVVFEDIAATFVDELI